jgi:hypothetical protein
MPHDRRNVERTTFAVDDDDGFTDRNFDIGARLRYVNGTVSRIERYRRTHLLEHRAKWYENRAAANERSKHAILFVCVRLGIDMMIVEKYGIFA